MRKLLMATALLGAMALPAYADAINNLTISVIPDPVVVPQSLSRPCIICATTQAHNPAGFGYNNFDSTGNTSFFNLFSSNITASFGNGIQGTPYTAGQLSNFLEGVGDPHLSFAVAVDINSTGAKSEFLELFQLINLGGPGLGDESVIFDIRNVAMPQIHNGNGKADYLIEGFDLSGINPGDNLIFRAQWSGAVDGGESFYIVPFIENPPVPGPAVGAGIPGVIAACGGLLFLAHRRRQTS
jgi:hypothetical protein